MRTEVGRTLLFNRAAPSEYSWIGGALAPLNDVLRRRVEEDRANARTGARAWPEHDWTALLSSAGRLLDRCLAYRREYQDLQGAVARQVLDYDLFEKQLGNLMALDEAAWQTELRRAEADAQRRAAEQFALSPGLGQGFEALASGAAALADSTVAAEEARRGHVRDRWAALVEHQAKLKARHEEPGHVLNFAERARSVLGFLLEYFSEAAEKAVAVHNGLRDRDVMDEDLRDPVHEMAGDNPLDGLVSWVRHTSRNLEQRLLAEVDLDQMLKIGKLAWKAGVAATTLDLELRDYQIENLAGARILAVGVGFRPKDPAKVTAGDFWSANVEAELWERRDRGDRYARIELHNCGLLRGNMPIPMHEGRQLYNFEARHAHIRVRTFMGHRSEAEWNEIDTVSLCLRLVGRAGRPADRPRQG